MQYDLKSLVALTWPEAEWDPADKPIAIVDGEPHAILRMRPIVEGSAAYVIGVNDKTFGALCECLRVETLHLYEMRVSDLRPLTRLPELRHLAVRWNTKLTSIEPLLELHHLEVLVFEDTPKLRDLSPVAGLRRLRSLEFSGGIWNKNTASSLEPLARLPVLQELALWNLKVEAGGLRPLAACSSLRELRVSNQFATADYAYLSVNLPGTECDMFAASQALDEPIGGKDTMVVGARKPLLSSRTDSARLAKYESEFSRLQEEFRSQLRPQGRHPAPRRPSSR